MDQKESKKTFTLDNKKYVCGEGGELLLFCEPMYILKDKDSSIYKEIKDPFQKYLFATYALDNRIDYDWKIEGVNIPILPQQTFRMRKEVRSHSNDTNILDMVADHWEENWHVYYEKRGSLWDNPERRTFIRIIPDSEIKKINLEADEESLKFYRCLDELQKEEDKPLFVGKKLFEGSMVEGICMINNEGSGFVKNGTWYDVYACIDRYIAIYGTLELTKSVRFERGLYRIKGRITNALNNEGRYFMNARYCLEIREAHLIKSFKDEPEIFRNFPTVDDYALNYESQIKLFKNYITAKWNFIDRSISQLIRSIIFFVLVLIVVLSSISWAFPWIKELFKTYFNINF